MHKLFTLTLPFFITFISILPMQAQSNITVKKYLSVNEEILKAKSNKTTDPSLLQAREELENVFRTYNNAIAQTVVATNQLSINSTGKPWFCLTDNLTSMDGEMIKNVILFKVDFHLKNNINLERFFDTYASFVAVQGLYEIFPCK